MAVDYMKKGSIAPIFYWQNQQGTIMLLPDGEVMDLARLRKHMNKLGYMLMTAETLPEAEKLQKKLQEQLKNEQDAELAKDEFMTAHRRQQVRDRLVARMNSSNTNEYEKDFIRMYLTWRENKHELFRKKFTQQIGHLDALEFDNPTNHTHDLLDRM